MKNSNKFLLVDAAPIDRLNKWCIRGAKAPNKWGGNPLDSNNACKRPTSPSSSLSWLVVPLLHAVGPNNVKIFYKGEFIHLIKKLIIVQ